MVVAALGPLLAGSACLANKDGNLAPPTVGTSTGQRILVPSYIVTGAGWNGIASSYPTVGIALLNVNSGPGTSAEANFQAQVATERAAGIQIYGYVSTQYGTITRSEVETEIADYSNWYGIKDIFIDEASTNCALENSYYQPLYNYIHVHGGNEILNPGTTTSQCYMSATDILDTFEGTYAQYVVSAPPTWTSAYPAADFFNEVYSVPTESEMKAVVSQSVTRGVGWIYITDLTLPNPYDALPSYWGVEVATVATKAARR